MLELDVIRSLNSLMWCILILVSAVDFFVMLEFLRMRIQKQDLWLFTWGLGSSLNFHMGTWYISPIIINPLMILRRLHKGVSNTVIQRRNSGEQLEGCRNPTSKFKLKLRNIE